VTTAAMPRVDPIASPLRRPGSVRRTSTMLMTWPNGIGAGLHLSGRSRDLLTPTEGTPQIVASADLQVVTGTDRNIESIVSEPPTAGLEHLVGRKGGGNLRAAIAHEVPDEVDHGTPLHLLLDDLAGSTLIAGFAFFRWADHIPEFEELRRKAPRRVMEGVCSGFRPGASSLLSDGTQSGVAHRVQTVGPLTAADDPTGWHELTPHPEIAMRRARRIDVWRDQDELSIDAMFRDSCWDPDGSEIAVHEYHLVARSDRGTDALAWVEARPRVLPYAECPLAAPNVEWLIGTPMRTLRSEVLERLRGPDCCTHLNDALRSLAEVPVLAASLPRE
jgi:Protein of unknown function (DUF2889)